MSVKTDDVFEPGQPVVPEGWDIVPFTQAAQVVSDQGKRIKQRAYLPSGKTPVIDQGQDYIGGYTDDEEMVFEGELPVVLFGDHTRSIKYVDKPFAVGAEGVKILKPVQGFDPKYFYYLLRSLRIPSRGYSRHFQFLKKFHLPRAPENQQKRIVAEIEKQFSRLDEAVANLKRVKANLKRYKAAVLKAAVNGHLVGNNSEWREVKLGAVAGVVDPQPSHRTPPVVADGIPYVGIGDFSKDGRVAVEGARKVSHTVLEEHRARYTLQKGDFVFGKIGTIGRPARLLPPFDYTLSANVVLIQPNSERVLPEFLYVYMSSPSVATLVQKEAKATTQAAFGIKRIRELMLRLPPIAIQERIVVEIDRRFSLLHGVATQVEDNLKRAEHMRRSVLHKAFSDGM